ncbi:uncharacterized protein [Drosophila kikkawai]|uniref:Uncharacterized protein n=1 Tax=Drosophila kikkawai TaxID=30033 RepID=A0ABM4GID0_DROKI
MKYFKLCWVLVIVLLMCSEDVLAAPKRKSRPKLGIKLPKININIHHNNIHIG